MPKKPNCVGPKVIVDTREQLPYEFPPEWEVATAKLESGDYSLQGFESVFSIERKSLTDLLGCIFTDRFTRELERLSAMQFAFLMIEATPWSIKNARFYKGNPEAVIGKLQAIELRYGVRVKFCVNRQLAQAYTLGLLEKFSRLVAKAEEGKS